jgi:hypothetical protein
VNLSEGSFLQPSWPSHFPFYRKQVEKFKRRKMGQTGELKGIQLAICAGTVGKTNATFKGCTYAISFEGTLLQTKKLTGTTMWGTV